jgi:uncharacterized Zn-binding protein involved in type VI secretion
MSDSLDGLAKVMDVFFNGRPASTPGPAREFPCKRTLREMISRGVAHVRVDGKLYRVECKEVKE